MKKKIYCECCGEEINGLPAIIRTKNVCHKKNKSEGDRCFEQLQKDNIRRHKMGKDIPSNFNMISEEEWKEFKRRSR